MINHCTIMSPHHQSLRSTFRTDHTDTPRYQYTILRYTNDTVILYYSFINTTLGPSKPDVLNNTNHPTPTTHHCCPPFSLHMCVLCVYVIGPPTPPSRPYWLISQSTYNTNIIENQKVRNMITHIQIDYSETTPISHHHITDHMFILCACSVHMYR